MSICGGVTVCDSVVFIPPHSYSITEGEPPGDAEVKLSPSTPTRTVPPACYLAGPTLKTCPRQVFLTLRGSPSFRLCRKFTLSCAILRMGNFAVCGQRPEAWPLDPSRFCKSSAKLKSACGACFLVTPRRSAPGTCPPPSENFSPRPRWRTPAPPLPARPRR